ncbi:SDR family NAD(P)-dependent oxidoreductase [Sphingorhabdus lacus]|uniref:SDR family oxidoreductase n=1 Tax=Sphingorhabdus lacus TaxID=392610 RepID=A0A6I6L1U0_9SPHN|nr:SDR family NAD(P)-dependent oxidoreductase [Sphingorhabdus lacus]QGY79570.1 SDR family oxidoreductase [Sphingorhabdus lacus]
MKTAVVTGAAQGVGLATSVKLASNGFHVVLTDLQPLESTIAELSASGLSVQGISGDIASEEFVAALASQVASEHGAADVLVNNAGISMIVPAEEIGRSEWHKVMSINLEAAFFLSQAFGRQMLAQGSGSIVNVASIAGLYGIIHRAAYNASKHGLIGLTRTLAAEWGGRGVRVNAVCPGWIKTDMDVMSQATGAYNDDDIIDRVPMGRFAKAEDVAAAIAFLASEDNFINGVSLPVDGGWTGDASWNSLRTKTRAG